MPTAFTSSEYSARLSALRTHMQRAELDLLIIDQFEHFSYFGGHLPTAAIYQCLLVPLSGEPVPVIRGLDAEVFYETSWLKTCRAFGDAENPVRIVASEIKRLGLASGQIGYEGDGNILTVDILEGYRAALPSARFVPFSQIMWEMRQVKSPTELAYLQKASDICDIGTAAGFEAAVAGANERDVISAITTAALKAEADTNRIVLMASGPRSAALHGVLGNRTLEMNDLLHVEMVPHYRGYTARTMRPKSIGPASDEQLRIAETMTALQDQQYAAMMPGACAGEVDAILRQGVLAAGLRREYTNVTGYTLGLVYIPRTSDFTRVFRADSTWTLEENSVFHMYAWAGGMAFSDTVVVTPEGGKRMTKFDRILSQ